MVTGDAESVANRVAKEVGIDTYEAQVLPEDKYRIVEKYKNEGYFVAMVGDGINDSPALKSADIGIAMGGIGSDAAIEAADVVLMDDDPLRIVNAIKHSKKIMNIVKQNIVFSLVAGALGLWFQIRSLLNGLNTIGIIQPYEDLSVAGYNLWERFGLANIFVMSGYNLWN